MISPQRKLLMFFCAFCYSVAEDETKTREKLILSEDCELVTLMAVIRGRLEVTTTHIYFFDYSSNAEEGQYDVIGQGKVSRLKGEEKARRVLKVMGWSLWFQRSRKM